jgi:DNA-binding SARP family transcriptional activator
MKLLILGPLELLDDDGRPVQLNGTKLRALTAILGLEAGRVVSTDRLLDGIYGDRRPQRAANSLQLLVSKLRHSLREANAGAEGRIVTRPPGYCLDLAPDDVDAVRFTRLVAQARVCRNDRPAEASRHFHEALAMWRGPLLADFAFDDFATSDRVRLHELRLSATEDCIDVDLALGRHVECVEALEEHVAAHPLRERPWGQLMVALYASARQAEALRAFQRARHLLGEELGIEPGPALRRLEAAILAQDPSLAGVERSLPIVSAGSPNPPSPGRRARRCAGRRAPVGHHGCDRRSPGPSPAALSSKP